MTPTPFIWNKSYSDTEQVRPYLDEFNRLHDEMEANGQYPYNDSFKGKIPGIMDAPDPSHEDTGIFLLQRLREQDVITRKEEQFINSGGWEIDQSKPFKYGKGQLVHTRYYSGGTGYSVSTVSVVTTLSDGLALKMPRQRNWRRPFNTGGKWFYRPDPT